MKTSESVAAFCETTEFFEDGYWGGMLGFSNYMISANGRVVSFRKKKPRFMRPIGMGLYRGLCLTSDDGAPRRFYVHQLVLRACDRNPEPGEEARHLNGNRYDNRIDNLCWGTRKENHADKKVHGTDNAGERSAMARLTNEAVFEMRRLYARGGWTFKQLAARFGVTTMTAHRAIRRQSWKHL